VMTGMTIAIGETSLGVGRTTVAISRMTNDFVPPSQVLAEMGFRSEMTGSLVTELSGLTPGYSAVCRGWPSCRGRRDIHTTVSGAAIHDSVVRVALRAADPRLSQFSRIRIGHRQRR
jgi:hypothetical protein